MQFTIHIPFLLYCWVVDTPGILEIYQIATLDFVGNVSERDASEE